MPLVYSPIKRRASIALADLTLALARSILDEHEPPGRLWQESCRKAAGWLIQSIDWYQRAGLGRRAEIVGRYLERLRRAYFAAGGT